MNNGQNNNLANLDRSSVEGLVTLARERMALAELQVDGLLQHVSEQQEIIEGLKAQYMRDLDFVERAMAQLSAPPPQQQQQLRWNPPQPSRTLPGPHPEAAWNPLRQGQQLPLLVQEDGGYPLPFPSQQGARRSHLIMGTLPDGRPGYVPDPNFVDEQGRRPVTTITPEMREQWAATATVGRSVEVYPAGVPGNVPAGGGSMQVKVFEALADAAPIVPPTPAAADGQG